MRLVRFGGAMSLDGYIAGPNGEYDWILMDPDIDFAGMQSQFDTYLIGRKTFEAMIRMGSDITSLPGTQNIVLSRTLKPGDYPTFASIRGRHARGLRNGFGAVTFSDGAESGRLQLWAGGVL